MGAPRAIAGLAFVGATVALFLRLRREQSRERVDLYFTDGSTVSFEPGSPTGDRLLPLARKALAAARG
jgi:hypothetical protein